MKNRSLVPNSIRSYEQCTNRQRRLHKISSSGPYDLRQQVLFASQAESGVVKYEHLLVHSSFLHVVETGLWDEAVRSKLRPFLQKQVSRMKSCWNRLILRFRKNLSDTVNLVLPIKEVLEGIPEKLTVNQGAMRTGAQKESKPDKPDRLMVTLEAVQSDIVAPKQALDT